MKNKILLWLMTGLMLMAVASAISTANNTVYFTHDDAQVSGSTSIEFIDGNPNGTITGATTGVTGKINQAFDFDASGDYIDVTDDADVDFSTPDMSIVAWINPDATHSGRIVGKTGNGAPANNINYDFNLANNYLRCQAHSSGTTNYADITDATTQIPNNAWTMVACTINSSGIGIWVNDTLVAFQNGNAAGTLQTTNQPMTIGALDDGTHSSFFNGQMDEISLWRRSLTQSDLTDLYNSGNGKQYPYGLTTVNFSITAIENYYGSNSINNFNASLNSTNYGTTTGIINTTIVNTNQDFWNITLSAENYLPRTYFNYNISLSGNLQANLSRNETELNITAYDFYGTKLNTFTATVSSYNSTHIVTDSTTSGTILFDTLRWNETYNVSVDAPNYSLFNNANDVTMSDFWQLQNFTSLYKLNTVNISFFDETTNNPVYNVSYELIGTIFSNNYTTTPNSSDFLELISPDDYQIRYRADSYPERFFSFTLTNRTVNELNLYLVTGSDNVTATVYDEISDVVTNAEIEVLKYDVSTNSYILVEKAATNFEGETILHLFKNTEFYKFRIRQNGTLRSILPDKLTTTNPTYIYGDAITFQIQTDAAVLNDFFNVAGIDYSLVFNNVTNNFRLEFSDPYALLTKACLYVDIVKATGNTAYANSCTTGSSGTVLVAVAPTNDTSYIANAYAYYDTDKFFLDNLFKTFAVTNATGNLGLFLVMILIIVFAMMGIWNPTIALILTPLPLIFASSAKLIGLPVSVGISLELLAIVIAYIINR